MGGRQRTLLAAAVTAAVTAAAMVAAPVATVVALCAAPSVARSDSGASSYAGLVLEVYGGARPAEAENALAAVIAELETRGFAAGPSQSRDVIVSRASRPGVATDVSVDALRTNINTGYQRFLFGEFDVAIAALEQALEEIRANPALIALDQTMHPVHKRALIGLSLSFNRQGRDAEADAVMDELVRTFPGGEISAREYGPEPAKYYRNQLAKLKKLGTGRLIVETNDESAVVFVNESFKGVSTVDLSVTSGRYRVYVQRGETVGRAYDVTVEPKRTTRVLVDAALDAALRTEAKWTGLLLPSGPDLSEQAIRYGAKLGRIVGAPQVILLGIRDQGGVPHLYGTVVAMTGKRVLREASLALSPAPPLAAKVGLGRFLAGEEASGGIKVSVEDGRRVTVPRADDDAGGLRAMSFLKWTSAVLTVGAVASGAVMLKMDGSCRGGDPAGGGECRTLWNTDVAGYATLGVGGGLALATIYLFLRDAESESESKASVDVALAPTQGGLRIFAGFAW